MLFTASAIVTERSVSENSVFQENSEVVWDQFLSDPNEKWSTFKLRKNIKNTRTCVCFCCCIKYFFVPFADINECVERKDYCNHLCTNTIGAYSCTCRNGYFLHQNGKTCLGETIMIFSYEFYFFSFYFQYYHWCVTKIFYRLD